MTSVAIIVGAAIQCNRLPPDFQQPAATRSGSDCSAPHLTPTEPDMRYYALEKLINLHDDYRKLIKIDEHNMLLVQLNGERYLVESQCPHRGHPLSEADITGTDLRCPLHGYHFDIASGALIAATEEPCRSLRTYELVYRDKEIGVML